MILSLFREPPFPILTVAHPPALPRPHLGALRAGATSVRQAAAAQAFRQGGGQAGAALDATDAAFTSAGQGTLLTIFYKKYFSSFP